MQTVLEAGHDAEEPVAARGLVRGAHGRSPVGGMKREARKATEASSRTPGEGPGAVPTSGEGARAGMYADPPASMSAAGSRRLLMRFFITIKLRIIKIIKSLRLLK